MKFKTTFIFIGIFIILFLFAYLYERETNKGEQKSLSEILLFPDFKPEQAVEIQIKSKEKTVVLTKKAEKWMVALNGGYYPADIEGVENVFKTIKGMHRECIISTDPAKYPLFELDEKNGLDVKIKGTGNSKLAHFYVGKNGPDLFSTYIRKEGEKEVLLLSGILKANFEKELREWRDRTIFNLNPGDILKVEILSSKKKLSLMKNEKGNWEMIEPEKAKAKQDMAEGLASALSRLQAYDFEDSADLKSTGLLVPSIRILIVMKNNTTHELLIGKDKDSSKRYVKRGDNPIVFLVQNYELMPILKEPTELKEG